jgi:hypothetical protein
MTLKKHWAIDVEDVARHRPDGFWWFGTGSLREGAHVDYDELQQMGFCSGREARTQLIEAGGSLTSKPFVTQDNTGQALLRAGYSG